MAVIRRAFGIKTDTVAGGSSLDDLTAGAIADADVFWPTLPGANLAKGITQINHDNHVYARRGRTKPLPLAASPALTVPLPCHRSIIESVLKKVRGGADTMTGTAPAAITHDIASIGFGATLPAVHAQLVRDDLNQKFSGCQFYRAAFDFPLMEEGTCEVELWPLFYDQFATSPPTAVYTGLSEDVMMLRDAKVFIDGSATGIPDLVGFGFTHINPMDRKHYADKNIVTKSIGSPAKVRKLWYPDENKVRADVDISYRINFGNMSTAQELAHDFAQIQKFVFEVKGGPLSTTPAATELLRITIFNGVHSETTSDGLSKDDDITTTVEGGAFYSDADSNDVKVEIVNGSSTAIT